MIEYEAGRELDALIAEKVMGIENILVERGEGRVGRWVQAWTWLGRGRCPSTVMKHVLPYSTDMAAAWQVVEKMDLFELDMLTWNGEWSVIAYSDGHVLAEAPTAPLAICRAALAAAEAEQ